jgi:hypothetical protein
MAEISRQQRQLAVDILAGVIPAQQRPDREGVAQVMRAGSGTLAASL